jgi:hypothetical protein
MNLLNNKPTLQVTCTDVAVLRDFKTFTDSIDNPEIVSFILNDITNEITENEYLNIQYVEDGKSFYVATVRTDKYGIVNLGVFSTREKARESLVYYENNNSSKKYDSWNEFFKDYLIKETFILDFDISEEFLDCM